MACDQSIQVSASLESLSAIRDFVRTAASDAGLSGKALADLLVAVDEAVTNVVLHGYRGQDGGIHVAVERREDGVAVRIVDEAAPFAPEPTHGADLTEPLKTRQVGGMGLHLIRTLTEEVRREQLPGGGNCITLIKKFAL